MYPRSVFLLDIDVELAWGFIDEEIDSEKMRMASHLVRSHLDDVFSLLDEYEIPVTWGIVGHLILDKCEREGEVAHKDMPRPIYTWMKNDWYKNDPCATISSEPAFYGKDIVDEIIRFASKRQTEHDIGCHSFSHQLFGDTGCTEAVAEAEIDECLSLLGRNYGIKPTVFIFPRDFPGHLNILRKKGFIAFRGRIPHRIDYSETARGPLSFARKNLSLASYLTSFYFGVPPPVVSARLENGLVNVPGCMCYNRKPFMPLAQVISKAIRGIDRAVKEKKIFHLYTHDINFGTVNANALLQGFEKILSQADAYRRRNQLEVTTLRRMALSSLEREKPTSPSD
jgi:peptidoglycan/xylan/chitin deacetylase (PgdA/CDA1 family)